MAAIELQNSSAKVIDLALKYGYDSPASLARAFQALHGVTPARAKQSGVTLRAYPRISFQISIKGVSAMNYRIEEKPAFRMVGTKERVNMVNGENFRRVPQFWNEVCRDGRGAQIAACSKEKPQYVYGVCAVMGEESFDYLIASMSDQEPPQGMEALEVPACTWAIFECVGAIPAAIQEVTQRIFTEWFPSSGYEHAEAPELEWYSVGDSSQMDYRSEIWMPVVKKSK